MDQYGVWLLGTREINDIMGPLLRRRPTTKYDFVLQTHLASIKEHTLYIKVILRRFRETVVDVEKK